MTRKEARNIIYEVINSGIISEELEQDLQEICTCICDDDFDNCKADCDAAYCEGCPYLENYDDDYEEDFDDEEFNEEE